MNLRGLEMPEAVIIHSSQVGFANIQQYTCHFMICWDFLAGVDFVGNIHLPHIDFATIHCYPGKPLMLHIQATVCCMSYECCRDMVPT